MFLGLGSRASLSTPGSRALGGQDSCWPRTRVLSCPLDGILSLEFHVRKLEPGRNKIPPLLPPWGHYDIVQQKPEAFLCQGHL